MSTTFMDFEQLTAFFNVILSKSSLTPTSIMKDDSDLPPLATPDVPIGELLAVHHKTLKSIASLESGKPALEPYAELPNITSTTICLFQAFRARHIRSMAEELSPMNADRLKHFRKGGPMYQEATDHR